MQAAGGRGGVLHPRPGSTRSPPEASALGRGSGPACIRRTSWEWTVPEGPRPGAASLPSNARAASTRWDQSSPVPASGRGIRPRSAHLDLSDKDPSENQNSPKWDRTSISRAVAWGPGRSLEGTEGTSCKKSSHPLKETRPRGYPKHSTEKQSLQKHHDLWAREGGSNDLVTGGRRGTQSPDSEASSLAEHGQRAGLGMGTPFHEPQWKGRPDCFMGRRLPRPARTLHGPPVSKPHRRTCCVYVMTTSWYELIMHLGTCFQTASTASPKHALPGPARNLGAAAREPI